MMMMCGCGDIERCVRYCVCVCVGGEQSSADCISHQEREEEEEEEEEEERSRLCMYVCDDDNTVDSGGCEGGRKGDLLLYV